jgi:hypothetical protein
MEEQEIEQTVDVTSEESSSAAPETPVQEEAAPSKEATATESKQQSSEDNVPFHKHPRWVERDQELKAERSAREELGRQYAQLEKRLQELSQPKTQSQEKDALIERLKGIDPEFGERMERLNSVMPTVEKLQQQLQQMEQQAFVNNAVAKINSLHTEKNVSPSLQAKYNAEMDLAYRTGKIKSESDITKYYNEIHDSYSKLLEDIKRSERASYTQSKKSDAKTPPSSKGKTVSPGKDFEFSKDPFEARQQLVKRALQLSKAESDL